jgi:hypothetical protein
MADVALCAGWQLLSSRPQLVQYAGRARCAPAGHWLAQGREAIRPLLVEPAGNPSRRGQSARIEEDLSYLQAAVRPSPRMTT